MVTIGLRRFIWHNLHKVSKAERLVGVTNFTVIYLHDKRKVNTLLSGTSGVMILQHVYRNMTHITMHHNLCIVYYIYI